MFHIACSRLVTAQAPLIPPCLRTEFTSDPFSHTEWQSLKAWFDEALEPFIVPGQRETRAFKLWKEYEPTAALKVAAAAK
jgi:hypothetical protein